MEKYMIEQAVSNFGTGISTKKMVSKLYWLLYGQVKNVHIVNEKYISVNGREFQLIRRKSKGMWEVKEMAKGYWTSYFEAMYNN